MRTTFLRLMSITTFALASGCGDDGDATTANSDYPYDEDRTVVIGGGSETPVATPDGDACIDPDETCIRPQDSCGDDGTADVIVDADGNVVDVICYPTSGAPIETIPADAVPVEKTQNGSVVVLDAADDGADIEGDLSVDANNVVLYGEDPDVAVLGGDLSITKNNTTVRGLRIQGDVSITSNNANFVFCVIEGNLTITGNNTTIAACEVWGDVSISGQNTVLVANRLSDPGPFAAQGLVCNDNTSFVDADADGAIADAELGAAVECSSSAP